MLECIIEAAIDTLKLTPVLFLAYLLMELLEHKTGEKTQALIKKMGHLGPLFGAAVGIIPQCGFSGAAASFYAAGVVSLGTLVSVFLATSDEMLPLLISGGVSVTLILIILGVKFLSGVVFGFIADLVFKKSELERSIHGICEREHCECEHHLLRSVIVHTLKIIALIFVVSAALGLIFHFGGEDVLAGLLKDRPVLGEVIAGLVGLIPNCSSSVLLTTLYIKGAISLGALISGVSVNAGVGLLVLFRMNKGLKQNLKITVVLYVFGVITGLLAGLIPV